MKQSCGYLLILLTGMMGVSLSGGPSVIGIREAKTLAYAAQQEAKLADSVLARNRERFVDYTSTSGVWAVKNDSTWCSGFIPGYFWYLWELTGDVRWRTDAMHWTEGVRSRATATDNDTGFQIYESFGLGYQFDESLRATYQPVLLQGAQTLVNQRYNPTIGCFRSWDQNLTDPYSGLFEVNIDQMMNLELVLWAGQNGGPAEYVDYAISHADKSWENNVRENGGTFHVVSYNMDGTVKSKRTHQGWTTDSTWSRGQAWAVYGYTMVYRYTKLPRMLERAQICYEYFINETLKDGLYYMPYSDFDAPLDSRNPRDTSAAAIVASAALELYGHTGNKQYLKDAEAFLEVLSSPEYQTKGTNWQSILNAGSGKWGDPETGTSFGDFYFLEAIWRWKGITQDPATVTGKWGSYDILDGRFVDTGGWMGWMTVEHSPYAYNYELESWWYAYTSTITPTGGWFYSFRP